MSFEVAAEAYDRYMGAWSRRLAPRLAAFAGVTPGMRVLDVGSGPGALTEELARLVGGDAVTAVDPSVPFVEAARTRQPDVDVRLARAESMPFASGTFDAALAQLVVHFMTDPVAGLAEMARVTRTGGIVAACVWDYAGDRGPLGPFWQAVRAVDPHADDESRLAGTGVGQLSRLFREAGLTDVSEEALAVTREYPGFEAWWEPFTHGVGPGGAYVARLDGVSRTELRERCRSMLAAGPFALTAHAWAARGRV